MKRLRRRTGLIYLLLLAVSWLVMSRREIPLPAGEEWREIAIPGKGGKPAALRYRKFSGTSPDLTPLILVHGSPMASFCFDPLLEKLPRDRTILVPDLPGFGASSSGFSDYSFAGHAAALRLMIEHESASAAHWVAYSQGGGPVLELSSGAPGVLKSLTMLSSVGVQEHELFGDYFLNHVLHGAQWIAFECARWGLPHFGLLDEVMLNTRYARNFYDGDMRPLREILGKFRPPVLIIHGKFDFQVMPAAAIEHFRILPQSEITWIRGGHLILMSHSQAIAEELQRFFHKVESGTALERASASEERTLNEARPFDEAAKAPGGGMLWLMLFGIALATLVSEDLTCLAAGLLVARGLISLPQGIGASFVGIWMGDMALYAAGRYGGRWLIRKAPLRWVVSEGALESGRDLLIRKGALAILISRFTPGMRLPLYVAAGVVKMPALMIGGWFFLAGILWTIPVVSLAAYFGEGATNWLLRTGASVFPSAVALVIVTWLVLRLGTALATHRGRRKLKAGWQRFIRWEFWPPMVFYPPVVIAMFLMGLRRRSLLAFTAVNPAIPHGGISGESKAAILSHLSSSGAVAPFLSLPQGTEDKLSLVSRWMTGFPLVVKPDVGERGRGVSIVHDAGELEREIESREVDTIVQKYIEGAEFGVFYIRHPHEAHGRIFSITIKIMTAVRGDGVKTLEELILDDERAYLSHRHFRNIYLDRLGEIPEAGEEVCLAKLGSHCRGALFLNGNHLVTPMLESEIERIARSFQGFHFGRFDLRCPDEESLKRGEGIRVIELNGVTSEATHIYHPHTPLRDGYRTLISQWRHAYDIGIANASGGAKISTFREIAEILHFHFNSKTN